MLPLTIRRHMMPGVTLVAFIASVLPAGRSGLHHLALGVTLLGLYWLVEWRGIGGTFEGRVPRRPLSMLRRALWLAGLVVCVADALWLHWTPWQGLRVRAVGVLLFVAGVALRFWSMRTLSRAFSYDIKVAVGQELVRRGPYRLLRHPAYTGLLLWSAGFALWNPSLPAPRAASPHDGGRDRLPREGRGAAPRSALRRRVAPARQGDLGGGADRLVIGARTFGLG